jgi:hypothetical protein
VLPVCRNILYSNVLANCRHNAIELFHLVKVKSFCKEQNAQWYGLVHWNVWVAVSQLLVCPDDGGHRLFRNDGNILPSYPNTQKKNQQKIWKQSFPSKLFGPNYQTSWRNKPENHNWNFHHFKYIRSHTEKYRFRTVTELSWTEFVIT